MLNRPKIPVRAVYIKQIYDVDGVKEIDSKWITEEMICLELWK